MSTIPSEDECISILLGAGASRRVVGHVCTVMKVAETIALRCGTDVELVRAGALLHDLGRTRTHGIRHGVEGMLLARERDLPEPLVLIIQKHIGAGITPQNASSLGLPPLDYVPSTLEEKVVCHADNLVDDEDVITSRESYRRFMRKGLEEQGGRMLEMHRQLSEACGIDIDELLARLDMSGDGPCSRYLRDR